MGCFSWAGWCRRSAAAISVYVQRKAHQTNPNQTKLGCGHNRPSPAGPSRGNPRHPHILRCILSRARVRGILREIASLSLLSFFLSSFFSPLLPLAEPCPAPPRVTPLQLSRPKFLHGGTHKPTGQSFDKKGQARGGGSQPRITQPGDRGGAHRQSIQRQRQRGDCIHGVATKRGEQGRTGQTPAVASARGKRESDYTGPLPWTRQRRARSSTTEGGAVVPSSWAAD
jgi:hypothetical protein